MLNIKKIKVEVDDIRIDFTRSLPVNEIEISQLVTNLQDLVSQETLLAQIPFVEDVEGEIEAVNNQKAESLKFMQASMGGYDISDEDIIEDE